MKRFLATLLIFLVLVQNILVVHSEETGAVLDETSGLISKTSDTGSQATDTQNPADQADTSSRGSPPSSDLDTSSAPQETSENTDDLGKFEENTDSQTSLEEKSDQTLDLDKTLDSDQDRDTSDDKFPSSEEEDDFGLSGTFGFDLLQLAQNTGGNPSLSGNTQTGAQPEKLLITEYFYHKDNSFIEITNIGAQDYTGTISLTGFNGAVAKRHLKYQVNIPTQTSIILARNNKYLANTVQMQITKHNYTVNQKTGIQISLSDENGHLDTFTIHKEWAADIKDAAASFEKVLINGSWLTTITRPDRKQNISGTFSANPGVYSTSAENAKDATKPKKQPTTPSQPQQPQNPSQPSTNQSCFPDNSAGFEIQELFAGNSSLPAYLELKYDFDITHEQIRLTGTLINQALTFNAEDFSDFEKNALFLITKTSFFGDNGIDTIIAPTLELENTSGSLILEGFDGTSRQVLDSIYLTSLDIQKAHYYAGEKTSCSRNFDEKDFRTPALDKRFSFLFSGSTPQIQYVYTSGGGGSYSCPTKADLCPDPKDHSNESSQAKKSQPTNDQKSKNSDSKVKNSDFNPFDYQIKIEDVLYDPPGADKDKEAITLLLTSGGQLVLDNLSLNIAGKTKKLSGSLEEGISQTFIGNFGFPNSSKEQTSIPVQLRFGEHIFDTYYYTFEPKTPKTPKTQQKSEKISGYKVFSVLDGDTFRYRDESGKLQSVRLLGVDAPESNTTRYKKTECYGQQSKDYLSDLIKGKEVVLEFDQTQPTTDRYGRQVAYVYVGDMLVNQHLLEKGYAREYTYKSTYSKQSEFKQTEQNAKTQKLGMRNSSFCPTTLQDQENRDISTQNLVIKITDIIYDPKGTDKGNEEIRLSIYDKSGEISQIDFSNQFGIYILDNTGTGNQISFDDFETGTGKFKDLDFLGTQPLAKQLTLRGDFGLPNKKSSCVALVQSDHLFDIACYQVGEDVKLKETEEKEKTDHGQFTGTLKILSLLPNPRGKDSNQEFIQLLYSGDQQIDLAQDFSLLINGKTKKKLAGILLPGEEKKIFGSFALPNTHACVALLHGKETLDTFCYTQQKEGTVIAQNNRIIQSLQAQSPELLKSLQLKRKENRYCITYQGENIKCLNAPKTRIDPLLKAKQQTVESALKVFEELLKKDYTALYYQTEIYQVFDLLKTAKSDLKDGKKQMRIGSTSYDRKDFAKIYQILQERTIIDAGKDILLQLLSPNIIESYQTTYQNWLKTVQ